MVKNMRKLNIVVLAGGTSPEREISIISGEQVCLALRERGHKALLVDAFFGLPSADPKAVFENDFDTAAAAEAMHAAGADLKEAMRGRREFFGPGVLELCRAADIVFLVLHGANGEDGRVQATFDLLGIRYTGTDYVSSAVAMDKHRTKAVFESAGVSTPRGITVQKQDAEAAIASSGLAYPLIVKPCCGGSSVGVTIVESAAELSAALELSFSYEPEAVVEEYIRGREFAVAVVNGEAYPVIEIAPKEGFYDYKNKYSPGATVETCPAEISAEETGRMQQEAVKAAEALGITVYCRLDFIMSGDGRVYCLEANTLPGMTPLSLVPQEAAAIGLSFPELCERLIEVSLMRYGETT